MVEIACHLSVFLVFWMIEVKIRLVFFGRGNVVKIGVLHHAFVKFNGYLFIDDFTDFLRL